jgi:P27 family predicted phage terminase small subunit
LNGTTPRYIEEGSDVAPGRPKYPKGISPDAKRVYKRLCTLLERRKTLTEGDAELLRLYAILFDRHARAVSHIETEGEIRIYSVQSSTGEMHDVEKPNLWLREAKDAERQMVSILDRCGLTPAARGKVKKAIDPKQPTLPEAFPSREEAKQPEPEIDLSTIREDLVQ